MCSSPITPRRSGSTDPLSGQIDVAAFLVVSGSPPQEAEGAPMRIKIYTTGGTIDKVYAGETGLVVGPPRIDSILWEGRAAVDYDVEALLRKDSLDITAEDRRKIVEAVCATSHRLIVITHGTDTILETARALLPVSSKVMVLTGAMQPAAFRETDAAFNVGGAIAAVQVLPEGVHLVMNGRVLDPRTCRKDRARGCFVEAT